MSQTPRPSDRPHDRPNVARTADLADLKATDALLDRIATGHATARDRRDPLIAAFADLRARLDEPVADSGLEVTQLLELLGERPLYLVDTEEAGDGSVADAPIALEPAASRSAASARPQRRVVDVRDGVVAARGAQVAAFEADPTGQPTDLARARRRLASQAPVPSQRWQRIAGQVALPAAAAVLLLGVGSGVSAAVTGDPMAPVSGVTKVVSQLPGIRRDQPTPDSVRESLDKVTALITANQTARAQSEFTAAKKDARDLDKNDQARLQSKIAAVGNSLSATPATGPSNPGVITVSPSPSAVASPTPSPSASPTAPASATVSPSVSPSPSASTSTSPSPSTVAVSTSP